MAVHQSAMSKEMEKKARNEHLKYK